MQKDELTVGHIERLEERISSMLMALGITSRLKGYGYLITGLEMAIKYPERVSNITKELYPDIAKKHKTMPDRVERGIRHAIQTSKAQGYMSGLNRILHCDAYKTGDKLTNSRFIALMSERLRYMNMHDDEN